MAKKLKTAKSTAVRKANSGEFVSAKQASKVPAATIIERTVPNIGSRLPKPSSAGTNAASLPDDTYAISMEAGEDVFARFDWALTQLAK